MIIIKKEIFLTDNQKEMSANQPTLLWGLPLHESGLAPSARHTFDLGRFGRRPFDLIRRGARMAIG
ncbi:hypothetical protein GCM10022419_132880 [Nonomuraea rosea]|uniref:Uncharacterized protein n=1 Tax=Nonomuraea rosea TaxID=638574 RepID=A0ABP7A4G3_9ACTN